MSIDKEQLQQAFAIFNQASDQLAGAYQELQQQVVHLTRELVVVNGELNSQLQQKAELSQKLGMLLEALPGGVVALDTRGCVEQVNSAALEMLGESLLWQPWQTILEQRLLATDIPNEWNPRQTSTPSLSRVRIESSLPDDSGRQILLINDITETYTMQEKLRRNERLAVMGEMAASLAHQLRTPLSTALLYAAHLGSDVLTVAERDSFSAKTLDRLHHLDSLISDMLLFVKGETAEWEVVGMSSLLTELQQIIEPQIADQKLTFRVTDKSKGASVLADRKALCGALTNLLENAMQASYAGGLVALECMSTNDTVILAVRDEGKGMAAEIQDQVFTPFFTTRAEGTGLGLPIVRSVIQSLGGVVTVASVAGKGSEFLIHLPRTSEAIRESSGKERRQGRERRAHDRRIEA